jgi:hypothetical protein
MCQNYSFVLNILISINFGNKLLRLHKIMTACNNKQSWNTVCLINVSKPNRKIWKEMFSGPRPLSLFFGDHGLHDDFCFILGSWFHASCSKYVHEYPTRCSNNVLVLFQDLYMFWVPLVPIIRSTILQLAVTGITYCNIHFNTIYKTL